MKDRQQRILTYIRDFIDKHDYPPSIREIQQECGISSTSVVDYNLKALEKQGFLRRDKEVSRAIELLQPGGRRPRVVPVPLIGTIAAGRPIPVPDAGTWNGAAEEVIEVSPDIVGSREGVFALRVKGNSMQDALISDGDIVLMQATASADDGDTVAAWLRDEQETTLKKLFREGERVRLQPRNESMAPIYADADNVEIQGKWVATISRS
jgi:repressor LexA